MTFRSVVVGATIALISVASASGTLLKDGNFAA